ncbi:MAG: hypothetical protein FVQ85_07220 [Planctomycetes bacterium]|nr:hypothetical protein [Planctomycetota bacterium]
MNVTVIYTKEYENNSNWTLGENEPKTNPIKANFKGKKSSRGANDRIEQSAIPHAKSLSE